jgi:hypothetical protein
MSQISCTVRGIRSCSWPASGRIVPVSVTTPCLTSAVSAQVLGERELVEDLGVVGDVGVRAQEDAEQVCVVVIPSGVMRA